MVTFLTTVGISPVSPVGFAGGAPNGALIGGFTIVLATVFAATLSLEAASSTDSSPSGVFTGKPGFVAPGLDRPPKTGLGGAPVGLGSDNGRGVDGMPVGSPAPLSAFSAPELAGIPGFGILKEGKVGLGSPTGFGNEGFGAPPRTGFGNDGVPSADGGFGMDGIPGADGNLAGSPVALFPDSFSTTLVGADGTGAFGIVNTGAPGIGGFDSPGEGGFGNPIPTGGVGNEGFAVPAEIGFGKPPGFGNDGIPPAVGGFGKDGILGADGNLAGSPVPSSPLSSSAAFTGFGTDGIEGFGKPPTAGGVGNEGFAVPAEIGFGKPPGFGNDGIPPAVGGFGKDGTAPVADLMGKDGIRGADGNFAGSPVPSSADSVFSAEGMGGFGKATDGVGTGGLGKPPAGTTGTGGFGSPEAEGVPAGTGGVGTEGLGSPADIGLGNPGFGKEGTAGLGKLGALGSAEGAVAV